MFYSFNVIYSSLLQYFYQCAVVPTLAENLCTNINLVNFKKVGIIKFKKSIGSVVLFIIS